LDPVGACPAVAAFVSTLCIAVSSRSCSFRPSWTLLPLCLGGSVCSPLPSSPAGPAFLCCPVVGLSCCPAWSSSWSFGDGLPGGVPLMVRRRSQRGFLSVALLGGYLRLCRPVACRPLGSLVYLRVRSPGRFCTIPCKVSSCLPSGSLNNCLVSPGCVSAARGLSLSPGVSSWTCLAFLEGFFPSHLLTSPVSVSRVCFSDVRCLAVQPVYCPG
jgi:hypothetical protein